MHAVIHAFTLTILMATCAHAAGIRPGPVTPVAPTKGSGQFVPDAACGKGQYLVVWQRSRNEGGRIECARLDAAGRTLDTKPVEVAPEGKWQHAPRVAFGPSAGSGQGGGVFLVVWHELRNGEDWDVYAARVSGEGKVLDKGGILVSTTPKNAQIMPAVVFDGKAFLVIWSEMKRKWKQPYRLTAARVSPDGRVTAPQILDAECGSHLELECPHRGGGGDSFPNDATEVDLAVAGDRVLVVAGAWLYAGLFTSDLKPAGSKKGLLKNNRMSVRRPTVATDGKDFAFSVWTGASAGVKDFVRVSRDGKLPGGAEYHRRKPQGEGPVFWGGHLRSPLAPALAFDGENYLLVWQARSSYRGRGKRGIATHLFARRIRPDGTSPDPTSVYNKSKYEFSNDTLVAGTSKDQPNCLPRLASDGKGHVLLVYEQHPTSPEGNVTVASRLINTR